MSVTVQPDSIALSGRCLAEDAEPLIVALQDHPGRPVSLEGVQRLHLAVVQVLLAARPETIGVPESPFLARHLAHLLQ